MSVDSLLDTMDMGAKNLMARLEPPNDCRKSYQIFCS